MQGGLKAALGWRCLSLTWRLCDVTKATEDWAHRLREEKEVEQAQEHFFRYGCLAVLLSFIYFVPPAVISMQSKLVAALIKWQDSFLKPNCCSVWLTIRSRSNLNPIAQHIFMKSQFDLHLLRRSCQKQNQPTKPKINQNACELHCRMRDEEAAALWRRSLRERTHHILWTTHNVSQDFTLRSPSCTHGSWPWARAVVIIEWCPVAAWLKRGAHPALNGTL